MTGQGTLIYIDENDKKMQASVPIILQKKIQETELITTI